MRVRPLKSADHFRPAYRKLNLENGGANQNLGNRANQQVETHWRRFKLLSIVGLISGVF
jgi:hypothetical protein